MAAKSLVEKLLVKPRTTLALVGAPEGYAERLLPLPEGSRLLDAEAPSADFIQVFVGSREELERVLPGLRTRLAPGGALWITYHKMTSHVKSDINRDSIWPIAAQHGLRPVRQIAIDDDWSALRFQLA